MATQNPDGYAWSRVTDAADFAGRDGAGAVVMADRMWMLGGWNPWNEVDFPLDCNNEVLSSQDGITWVQELAAAPWEARHTAGYAVHRDRMWIVGGDIIQGHYQDDVWSSPDGVQWDLVLQQAPWGPRALHHTVVFDDHIWVMGGQTLPQFAPEDEHFYADVWRSADGLHWEQVSDHAPWGPRGMIGGAAVHQGAMWIIGGGTYDTPERATRTFHHDVWRSIDGRHWDLVTDDTPWPRRQYHDVASFDGKLWVVAGFGGVVSGVGVLDDAENLSDTWYSEDGRTWHEVEVPWAARHASCLYTFRDALWLVAGNHMDRDVWRIVSAAPPLRRGGDHHDVSP